MMHAVFEKSAFIAQFGRSEEREASCIGSRRRWGRCSHDAFSTCTRCALNVHEANQQHRVYLFLCGARDVAREAFTALFVSDIVA